MKTMKKVFAILLVVLMIASVCSLTAFASEPGGGTEPGGTEPGGGEATTPPTSTVTITRTVKDAAYKAYKLLDVSTDSRDNPSAYSYTVAEKWKGFFYQDATAETPVLSAAAAAVFKLENGYIVVKDATIVDNGDAIKTFAAAAKKYADDNSIAPENTFTADGQQVSTTTTDGYYLITSSLGTNLMIDTTPGNVTIVEKNGIPTIDKKIVGKDGGKTENEVNVGDIVDYYVEVNLQPGNHDYVVVDTMSKGLTYLTDDTHKLQVVDYDTGAKISAVDDTDPENPKTRYTATATTGTDGVTTITVTFEDWYTDSLTVNADGTTTNHKLELLYSARLNEDAVIADAGNPNTVKLQYNNGTDQESAPVTVKTYTYGFDLFKFHTVKGEGENAQVTKSPLAGAEFQLKDEEGKVVKFKEVTDTSAADHTVYVRSTAEDAVDTIVTPESGYVYLKGLEAGTYTLTETKEPAGYNKLNGDIEVTIVATPGQDGTIADDCTVNVKFPNQTDASTASQHTGHVYGSTNNQAVYEVEIENKAGAELPSTGGIGTTLFYVVGGMLLVGAGVLLVTKKRMEG